MAARVAEEDRKPQSLGLVYCECVNMVKPFALLSAIASATTLGLQGQPSAKSVDIRLEPNVASLDVAPRVASFLASASDVDDTSARVLDMVGLLAPASSKASASDPSNAAQDVMKRFAQVSSPRRKASGALLDPIPQDDAWHCEVDFAQACPNGFVAGDAGCAPTSEYVGPCASEVKDFRGLSDSAKERWSALCLAWWPCVGCERDFSEPCPRGWSAVQGFARRCSAPPEYAGPCANEVDFDGFNALMLSEWSEACAGFWGCSSHTEIP